MFEFFQYQRLLQRCYKKERKLKQQYVELEKKYSASNDEGHLNFLGHEIWELNIEIEDIKSSYLLKIANRYSIPLPPETDETMYKYVEHSALDGPIQILTNEGMFHIKNLIREEKRHIRESVGFWISVITGLIGVLIGFVSVLKS